MLKEVDLLKIKITMAPIHSERMLPNSIISNMGVEFIINDPSQRKCDAWFILDDYGPENDTVAICPSENIFFFMGEAEQIKIYNRKFIQQFHNIITSQKYDYGVKNVIKDYFATWFVGLKFGKNGLKQEYDFNYEDFLSMNHVEKTKLISVVSSNKSMCEGHRQRLAFVEKLKKHFGDKLDVFGRGINDFSDKWEVLSPYKYHIAIENQQQDYYITEKLMDPYIAFCYPFYFGAPNVRDIYPHNSLVTIDIYNAERSIAIIEETINQDTYAQKIPFIKEARQRTLNEENFFVKIAKLGLGCSLDAVAKENVIRHECEFTWRGRIKRFIHWGE